MIQLVAQLKSVFNGYSLVLGWIKVGWCHVLKEMAMLGIVAGLQKVAGSALG